MRKLTRSFYNRPTIDVAIDLLGCHLIVNDNGIKTGGIIVETEAYIGEDDPACHAFRGPTKRNKIMYGKAGFLYVYFTYGNHFMLNIVTEREGFPSAVLLRGLEPIYNIDIMALRRKTDNISEIASGPGKLAKALDITTDNYGTDLCGQEIYLIGPAKEKYDILSSPRIGIGDHGPEKLWRFYIRGNPHVSQMNKFVRDNSCSLLSARKISFDLNKGKVR